MSAKRLSQISDPTAPGYIQESLFAPISTSYNPYPRLVSKVEDVREIMRRGAEEGKIGLDFEGQQDRPTIFGVACKDTAGSVRYDRELVSEIVELAEKSGATIVGHSTIGAEKQYIENALGKKTPVSMYGCSMIGHHLTNGHLTKMAGKQEEEDAGSLGLMGLSTVASIETDLPAWKFHRGIDCQGPCPTCRCFDYCSVDAWASLAAAYNQEAEMSSLGIPQSFYRDCLELTDICMEMEKTGLRIDRDWVKHMDKAGTDFKDTLFPFDLINKKPVYKEFNPKAAPQIIEYFGGLGITLKDSTKGEVAKVLEKVARKEGIAGETIKELCENLELAPELSNGLDVLYRLYQFKDAGKGVKSWFDDKYYGKDGRIHPRFITTGSCTGRLSSSRPNFQNLGARGWAKELKKAVIPDEGMDFVESDWSQLELRIILYLAGFDVKQIPLDAFKWLVGQAPGAFDKAASLMAMSSRDVAKSISHGSDYLEGIQIKTGQELETARMQEEIRQGARVVYTKKNYPQLTRDWTFRGGYVTFTGANLAERIFGSKTLQNRRKAHEIVEDIYFKEFFAIREWQMRVLEQAETGLVKSPAGRVLKLYGSPEDDAKMAVAFFGQGVGADHSRSVMLWRKRLENKIPCLQIHDSLVEQIPKSFTDQQAKDYMKSMQEETPLLPGFICPGKVKRGKSYGHIELI